MLKASQNRCKLECLNANHIGCFSTSASLKCSYGGRQARKMDHFRTAPLALQQGSSTVASAKALLEQVLFSIHQEPQDNINEIDNSVDPISTAIFNRAHELNSELQILYLCVLWNVLKILDNAPLYNLRE